MLCGLDAESQHVKMVRCRVLGNRPDMSTVRIQVVIDCADPASLAEFWATALRYEVQSPPEGFADWASALAAWGVPEADWNNANAVVDPEGAGPRVYFQRVPESKSVKNRVHLDVKSAVEQETEDERQGRIDAEVQRLISAGASVINEVEERGERWVVMADPEANEFCVS